MSLFNELKRRNVFRVAAAYVVGAWLIVQVVETLFPIYELSEAAVRLVVNLLAIGLIPVLVLSWVFEWTPEGIKREAEVDDRAPASIKAAKRLDRIILVVLALALGYFAFDKFVLDPARDARQEQAAAERGRTEAFIESYGDKSIAVLPFADMSASADQAYFSDGIAEEILNLLAKVNELRVISRSSAFQYRGDDIHIPTVAEELNVSYVLEGSVRKAGDQVRITAQLIDARADTHLWSDTYDREFSDIFAIQDEISAAIVNQLHIELLGERLIAERTDPETYALYLQARHHLYVLQDYSEATEQLVDQALELDSDYVPALNLKVEILSNLTGDSPNSKYSTAEGLQMMRESVDRVLAIDPRNSAANAHRGWMAYWYRDDIETAAVYLNRALEFEPSNVFALFVAGVINGYIGRNEEAVLLEEAALARDPLCNRCLYVLSRSSFRAGDLDKAQAAAERRMRSARGGWFSLGNIHLFRGDIQKALECYENQKSDRIGWLSATAIAHFELGDEKASDAALSELKEFDEPYAYLEIAKVHAWRDEADLAFELLDRFYDPARSDLRGDFSSLVWDPFFRNLHDDPRWLALREKAGLSPERLAGIEIAVPDIYRSE